MCATARFPGGAQAQFLHGDGTHWTAVAAPVPQETGVTYTYEGIAGSGPHDIWAVGNSVSPSTGAVAEIDHLTCG